MVSRHPTDAPVPAGSSPTEQASAVRAIPRRDFIHRWRAWHEAVIAYRSDAFASLATRVGQPVEAFTATMTRFNNMAEAGVDSDFDRGRSAYDWHYHQLGVSSR